MSSVRGLSSHPIFCLFINPLISGYNPFTKRTATASLVTLFIVGNLEYHQKRTSKWALKSAIHSSFFCLCVWIINQLISKGRKNPRNGLEKFSCYFVSSFWSVRGGTLKIKDLKYPPQGFAILFLASIFGLPQVLPICALAVTNLTARVRGPNNYSKFFKNKQTNFWGSSLELGNSWTLTLSSVFDQRVKYT